VGKKKRPQPTRLSAKLKFIRVHLLKMRQEDLLPYIVPDALPSSRGIISEYETGKREPSLLELLRYVKIVKERTRLELNCDDLIDDSRNIPLT
jgi:hypothetical protein